MASFTSPELSAPAGSLDKLKVAVTFGADAVYFGGRAFSLRAGAAGLSDAEMAEGISFAHARGAKAYLALNAFMRDADIDALPSAIESAAGLGADAFIVSDPGALALCRKLAPDAAVHISTQANVMNAASARFWADHGASRIVLSRELTLEGAAGIIRRAPCVAFEVFVHGAMCVSYSGRCLLSAAMTGRSANSGECAQPCRYSYAVAEEKRPGAYFPVEEAAGQSYIFNAADLSMISHLPELAGTGAAALKIEGRMKSAGYAAGAVYAYRRALDDLAAGRRVNVAEYESELSKISHRPYGTGFYFGDPLQVAGSSEYVRERRFLGIVRGYADGAAIVEQRGKFSVGESAEFLTPDGAFGDTITSIRTEDGARIETANRTLERVMVETRRPVPEYSILRSAE
ncbi:MAG: U32 family peptidase [Clostridiales bacterium]|jgi:putative protease|nr:U32 family peptidase [Clostridiales bacterium]